MYKNALQVSCRLIKNTFEKWNCTIKEHNSGKIHDMKYNEIIYNRKIQFVMEQLLSYKNTLLCTHEYNSYNSISYTDPLTSLRKLKSTHSHKGFRNYNTEGNLFNI